MVILFLVPVFSIVVLLFTCFSKNSSGKKKDLHSMPRSPAAHAARSMTSTARTNSTFTATARSASNETGTPGNEQEKPNDEFKFHIQSSKHTTSENKTNLDSLEGEDNPLLNKKVQAKLRGVPSTCKERKVDETQSVATANFGSAEGNKKTRTKSTEVITASTVRTVPSQDRRAVVHKARSQNVAGSGEKPYDASKYLGNA